MTDLYPDLASMLAAHGITAREVPFDHEGYSNATMARIEQDGKRYILKRTSRTRDWIIQMTSDHAMREAQIAASHLLDPLAPALRSPSIAAANDGGGFALLMHDLTPHLLSGVDALPAAAWHRILAGAAALHARFWAAAPPPGIGWCGMRERLLMLSEPAGERLKQAGLMEFGFGSGWERFHATAPAASRALVRSLHANPAPLLDVFPTLPQTLLHNDIKIANAALDADSLWLFDWALAGFGPVGCELGWLLAVNSSRLTWSLDETAERYARHLRDALGRRFEEAAWPRQRAVAHIAGIMMFGWAKEGDELEWWCDRALQARSILRL